MNVALSAMTPEILELSPDLSAGVQAEVEALGELRAEMHVFETSETPARYWQSGSSLAPYQYELLCNEIAPGARVLDVGVGFGQSSFYLAERGYRVTAVEPTMALCRLIRDGAARFGLPIQVVQGVGEQLDRIPEKKFDVVIFNSSLHHCDDPVVAIAQAYDCLQIGGMLYLVNENMLKPWQTEAGYLRRLAADPVGMGDYGGNEHSYHNSKYLRLLRTKFTDVELVVPRAGSALEDLEMLLARKIGNKRVYSSNAAVLTRFCFYIVRERLRRLPTLYSLLARASFVPAHFRARKI